LPVVDADWLDGDSKIKKLKVAYGDGSEEMSWVFPRSISQEEDGVSNKVRSTQPNHDDLNGNANLQVGDVDVSAGNPVPVRNDYLNPPAIFSEGDLEGEDEWIADIQPQRGRVLIEFYGASWDGTLSLQVKKGVNGPWRTWKTYTQNGYDVVDIPASTRYIRVGFAFGDYVSGMVSVSAEQS